MSLLKRVFCLLLLAGFISPAFAATDGVNLEVCGVYSETDKKEGDKKEGTKEEEEPDCE